jgi:TP901 family phage tail tape measure protein
VANKSVSVSLRADVAQFQSAMKAAATATKQVEGAAKGAGKATQSAGADAAGGAQKITTAATTAATATTRLGTSAQDAATKTQQIGKRASTAATGASALGTAAGAAATGTSRLGAAGEAVGAGLGRARDAVSGAATQVRDSIPSFEQLATIARDNEQAWSTASTALMGVGAAALAGVGMAVKTYADYDQAMSSVRAATHASESDMQALGDAAIKAGADTAYSAEEAARGIEELAKAGVSTSDILGGGLDGALSLAAAGGIEVGDAAEIAASALTQFKLEGSDVGHVADLLAAGAGKAQGSVQHLGAALNQSGLVAAQTGLSIEETTGGLAAFASAGLIGSDAGTSFKTMLQRLTPQSAEAAELMDELGISAYDSQGEFIGLSEYAGQLQGALSGMSEEQRNAAMQTLFGADAVRAASVLYEQGAAGVEQWEAAVNDAGYAAETAALMQDNLAGDLEKLGGAIETAFLKAGSGGNDALRTLVQGAESVVDAIGRIPGPVLTTVTAIAGLTGGLALTVGAGMKVVGMVSDAKDAFSNLGVSMKDSEGKLTRTGRALDKAGRAAARAATAFAALQIAGAIDNVFDKSQALSIEEVTNALTDSSTSLETLDEKFSNLDFVNGKSRWSLGGTVSDINSLGDAVARVSDRGGFESIQEGLIGLTGQETAVQKLAGSIGEVDTALAGMFEAGDMAGATEMFAQIASEAEASGASLQDVADQFPELEAAVLDYATSLDVALTDQEVLDAMMGTLPPKLVDAAGGAEEAAAGLEGLAGASEETADSLEDVVDSLSALGLLTVDSRAAIADYEESVSALGEAAAAGGVALNELGTDFDMTSESGRAASQAMGEVASSGWDAAEGIIAMGGSAGDAQASLQGTYDTLMSSAQQMGLSAESAEDLARSLLGIPDNVSVETWMDETAAQMAQTTKESVDGIPEGKSVDISVDDQGSAAAVQAAVAGIQGTDVKAYVSDQGTVSLTQSQINGILGKTTKVEVTDAGTVYHTQGKIDGVTDGDALITVDDNGTIVNIQSNINGVQDGAASVSVDQSGEGTASIQQAINNIRGKSVTIAVNRVASGLSNLLGGNAAGGRAPHIPGISAAATGMRLPTTGPGTSITDGFLGIASDGMPRVRVDAGEWIINSRQSKRFDGLLGAINRDDPRVRHLAGYATGGRAESAPSPAAPYQVAAMAPQSPVQIDYTRLAQAMTRVQIVSPVSIGKRDTARIVQVGREQLRGR